MAAAGAALLGGDERQVDGVGHEIGAQQKAVLLALGGEIIRLAGKPVLEVVRKVEDEIDILVAIDDRRRVGHGDEAYRLLAGTVEVLIRAVQRNGEDRARLPLKRDASTGIV